MATQSITVARTYLREGEHLLARIVKFLHEELFVTDADHRLQQSKKSPHTMQAIKWKKANKHSTSKHITTCQSRCMSNRPLQDLGKSRKVCFHCCRLKNHDGPNIL